MGRRQTTGKPSSGNSSTMPRSRQTPSRCSPNHCGQSSAKITTPPSQQTNTIPPILPILSLLFIFLSLGFFQKNQVCGKPPFKNEAIAERTINPTIPRIYEFDAEFPTVLAAVESPNPQKKQRIPNSEFVIPPNSSTRNFFQFFV